MSGQAILLKARMSRFPVVDVSISSALLWKVFKYYYEKNDAIVFVGSKNLREEDVDRSNALYVSDYEESGNHIAMLLVRGDPARPAPGFVNIKTKIVVLTKPDPDFVRGISSHIAFSKAEIAAGFEKGKFRIAVEQASGIGRSLIREFILNLLGRYATEYPHEFVALKKIKNKKEKAEQIQYRPTVTFSPQMNAKLSDDLRSGKIGGFKLTRGSTIYQGEIGEPVVKSLNVQLHATIAPTNEFGKVRHLVEGLRSALSAVAFESLNLELVDENGDQIQGRHTIDVENIDEPDLRYCKSIPIPDVKNFDEIRSKFHEETKNFLVKCLNDEGNWK